MNHHQLQDFLITEWEADHGDVIDYCNVLWLSCSKLLRRVAELKDAISKFMTMKNKPIFEFDNVQFMANFAFFTDHISSHLAIVNLKLQQRRQLMFFSPM